MRNNKTKLFLIISILSVLIFPSMSSIVTARENISPIESIDWFETEPDDETEENSSAENNGNPETDTENDTDTNTNESENSSEENPTQEYQMGPVDLDTSSPVNFLQDLSQLDQRIIEYVTFETEGEVVELISQNMLKDGSKYYAARLIPPFLPQALFINTDMATVQEAYVSVDDLIRYSADALNTQPQIYEGTVAESFYIFSQENVEEIQGTVIEIENYDNEIISETLMITNIEDFLIEVSIEWLNDELVQDSVFETELGLQIDINGEAGQLFNEIANRVAENYPELEDFFTLYASGFEGTVTIDYDNGLYGMGLLYSSNQEQLAGTELYIQASDAGIIDFTDDIIFSYEEFVDLVGFDVISEINQLEANLTPDMFDYSLE